MSEISVWTVEITEMRGVEGHWGLRETEITGGLMS